MPEEKPKEKERGGNYQFWYPSGWDSLLEKKLKERGYTKAEFGRAMLRKELFEGTQ